MHEHKSEVMTKTMRTTKPALKLSKKNAHTCRHSSFSETSYPRVHLSNSHPSSTTWMAQQIQIQIQIRTQIPILDGKNITKLSLFNITPLQHYNTTTLQPVHVIKQVQPRFPPYTHSSNDAYKSTAAYLCVRVFLLQCYTEQSNHHCLRFPPSICSLSLSYRCSSCAEREGVSRPKAWSPIRVTQVSCGGQLLQLRLADVSH